MHSQAQELSPKSLAAQLDSIRALYRQGKYLTAYQEAKSVPFTTIWTDPEACVMAGQLAGMLGSHRLRRLFIFRAQRIAPQNPRASYYYARSYFGRHGPFAARELIAKRNLAPATMETPQWQSFLAYLDASLRNFPKAEERIAQALDTGGDDPWIHCEHSYIQEVLDRYEDSLSAVERAFDCVPWYRPAVQQKANLLLLLGRDEEAYDFLCDASRHLESDGVQIQRFNLEMEWERFDQAAVTLNRIDALSPLKDNAYRSWLSGARADLAYFHNRFDEAIEYARESKNAFHCAVADTLTANKGDGKRLVLDVPFVRQHHNTCGPATLTALTRYFGAQSKQADLVDAIWYNGTTGYHERRWGSENGWHVREFRADWASALALLDRGVPFTVSTVEPGSAHLQAVIGYDSRRGTLLVRDPYHRHNQEFIANAFFERYRSTGPRAMVYLPRTQAELLEGINLPEADQYDTYHQLEDALEHHKRERAAAALERLRTIAPESRLTLSAERDLAGYDRNDHGALRATGKLRGMFPHDVNLQTAELEFLQRLGDMAAYAEALRSAADKPDADPLLRIRYANYLADNAQQRGEAKRLLRRVLRQRPLEASAHGALAWVEWSAGNRQTAAEHYRTAADLKLDAENYALDYFRCARFLGKASEALDWLTERVRRYGSHSAYPAITLCRAYQILDREHDGIAVLETTLKERPDDEELLLFLADVLRIAGRIQQAERRLGEAEGKVAKTRWLAARAYLLSHKQAHEEALQIWQQIAKLEPLNRTAQQRIAELLAKLKGRSAAEEYTDELTRQFPHDHAIIELRVDWLDRDRPEEGLPVLERLLEIHPQNAWGWRQLALLLSRMQRHREALNALEKARALEPESVALFQVEGDLRLATDEVEAACECYRKAIRLSVDSEYAIDRLLEHSHGNARKREALAFIRAELITQVVSGDGLLAYQTHASEVLSPDELLEDLQEAWRQRPDLWHTWSALIQQHLLLSQTQEACDLARNATDRFPLLPRIWLDLAQCRRLVDDDAGEADALQRVLELNPEWVTAILRLSDNYERAGDYHRSRDLLQAAVNRNSEDARLRALLAHASWRLGEQSQAVTHIRTAIELAPGYGWAWERLRNWAEELDNTSLPLEIAQGMTSRNSGDASAWLALARESGPGVESLKSIDRALALEPRSIAAHELRIQHLTLLERYEEARNAVQAPVWNGTVPVELRVNLPWIRFREGQAREAIAELKTLLDEEPRYAEGWRMLAAWAETIEDTQLELDASQHYASLQPNNATAQNYLADALASQGETVEAASIYQRVLRLSPNDLTAACCLFDLQMENGETEAASETLRAANVHLPSESGYVLARELRLHCHNRQFETACDGLKRLCSMKDLSQWPFDTALTAFTEAGWETDCSRTFEDAINSGNAIPEVGQAWAKGRRDSGRFKLASAETKTLFTKGEAGLAVIDAYLDFLIDSQRTFRLTNYIRRHRTSLHKHTATWGTIGYFYTRTEKYRKAMRWMNDWRKRPDTPAWALNNLAICLRRFGHWEQALSAAERGIISEPGSLIHSFKVWIGLEMGLRGELEKMEEHLHGIDPTQLSGTNQFVLALLKALHHNHGLGAERRNHLKEVRTHLREALKLIPGYQSDKTLARIHRRVMKHISGTFASFPLNYFYYWRLL